MSGTPHNVERVAEGLRGMERRVDVGRCLLALINMHHGIPPSKRGNPMLERPKGAKSLALHILRLSDMNTKKPGRRPTPQASDGKIIISVFSDFQF
jgi:hypothetical protein